VVSGDGEHDNATDATCDLRFDYDCMDSLRLHPHAETKKKASSGNRAGQSVADRGEYRQTAGAISLR
jgi:hypothetical protein